MFSDNKNIVERNRIIGKDGLYSPENCGGKRVDKKVHHWKW